MHGCYFRGVPLFHPELLRTPCTYLLTQLCIAYARKQNFCDAAFVVLGRLLRVTTGVFNSGGFDFDLQVLFRDNNLPVARAHARFGTVNAVVQFIRSDKNP